MNIQIVNITAQDRELISGLDPFERLSFLNLPGAFALAALVTDEHGEILPAGLMTGFADNERLSISHGSSGIQ